MEHGKPIEIEVEEFFQGMTAHGNRRKEYTDLEKKIIVKAYEEGYNLEKTATKLKTNTKKMRRFYDEYKRSC